MSNKALNRRQVDKPLAGFRPVFIILAQAAKMPKPTERALNDPPDRNDDKALGAARSQRDFQVNPKSVLDPRLELCSFVAAIGQDLFQAFPEGFRQFLQQVLGSFALPQAGGMSDDFQQVTHRVHCNVPLASIDLLGSIKTVFAADFGRFDTLAVEDGLTRLGVPSCRLPHSLPQGRIDRFPGSLPTPFPKMVVNPVDVGYSCGK
jgi:hypothetical protein